MTYDEQVIRAEIFQALECVESNFSFASFNGDNQGFKLMFPDSKIAPNFSQHKTKVKYKNSVWNSTPCKASLNEICKGAAH